MIIKCSFLVAQESGTDGCYEFANVPPLPEYIIKKGPYVNNNKGAPRQIIIVYQFHKAYFAVAWECISKQLDCFRGFSGFTLSAHIYDPRPHHLSLDKERAITELLRY